MTINTLQLRILAADQRELDRYVVEHYPDSAGPADESSSAPEADRLAAAEADEMAALYLQLWERAVALWDQYVNDGPGADRSGRAALMAAQIKELGLLKDTSAAGFRIARLLRQHRALVNVPADDVESVAAAAQKAIGAGHRLPLRTQLDVGNLLGLS